MAKALAPSVVSPPCASSSAWNSSTIVPSSAITGGRNSTAPAPGPVGWLELPVNEGSLIALSTKVNAPAAPSSSVFSGRSRTSVTTWRAPWTTKGAAASVQPTACVAGRNPSAMCMPYPSHEGRRRAGGHEPLGQGRGAGPVQVQVGGVHAPSDEPLRPAPHPAPGRRRPGGGGGDRAVELVAAHPRAGRREHRVAERHGLAVAEGQLRRHDRVGGQDPAH